MYMMILGLIAHRLEFHISQNLKNYFFYFVCVYKLHSVLMKLRCHQLYTFSIAPHASLAAVDVYDATGLDSALIVILYLSKFE